jgi:hypothetical protein
VTDFEATDFFRGTDLIADPYEYFDWLREQCPVHQETHHDVMVMTGYDEAVAIYADSRRSLRATPRAFTSNGPRHPGPTGGFTT